MLLFQIPEKELIVKMFVLNGWTSEDQPPDTSSMITLVAKVEKWQQQSGNGAITVMCRYYNISLVFFFVFRFSFNEGRDITTAGHHDSGPFSVDWPNHTTLP